MDMMDVIEKMSEKAAERYRNKYELTGKAIDDMKSALNFVSFQKRLAMVMGESCPPGARDDIRSRLRAIGSAAPVVNNGYGFTEMMGPAIECVEMGGRHQGASEQFYFEIVDPETGEPLPDGEKGALLISHLNRRGTVLLRYRAGDIVAVTHETCPHCGRWEPRFLGDPYRADGIIKIKGTLVNPASLQEELSAVLGSGVAEYQVTITREDARDQLSQDAVVVRLACAPGDRDRLAAEVRGLVRRATQITPEVEFLPSDGFSEMFQSYKFRRFVDER
jgi:phenylacetate-coenzyme A ligase PaaK-like adenylate-forming protein